MPNPSELARVEQQAFVRGMEAAMSICLVKVGKWEDRSAQSGRHWSDWSMRNRISAAQDIIDAIKDAIRAIDGAIERNAE